MKHKGTITALVTPFKGQEVDYERLKLNIRFQINVGIDGILLLGSTGESATLSQEEQARIIATGVEEAKGKVPIWVGTGTYCTRETIKRTKRAEALGADVAIVVTPYYNKPTQEGIYRHFEALSEECTLPICLYNIQGRCGINIETSTLMRIAKLKNIIGVKEASGNINQAGDVLNAAAKLPNFLVFSGDDVMTLPMVSLGAHGVISVVSNLLPAKVVALTNAALQGDFATARSLHHELLPLYKAAFIETNPTPIKAAMHLLGMMPTGECRLPLCPLTEENRDHIHRVLKEMQLIA